MMLKDDRNLIIIIPHHYYPQILLKIEINESVFLVFVIHWCVLLVFPVVPKSEFIAILQ